MKLFSLLCVLFSLTVLAEDNKPDEAMAEMMKKAEAYGRPGEEHKSLAEMAGKWTYTTKWWMTADAKPEESKGTGTFRMILGGRFLEQNIKGKSMGQNFEGHGMTGYDNLKKQYDVVWMDNMSTGIIRGTGTYDPASKVMTETGEYSCPMSESGKATYRGETKMIDKNNMTYTMYGKGMTGKGDEFKMMEITYKRAK